MGESCNASMQICWWKTKQKIFSFSKFLVEIACVHLVKNIWVKMNENWTKNRKFPEKKNIRFSFVCEMWELFFFIFYYSKPKIHVKRYAICKFILDETKQVTYIHRHAHIRSHWTQTNYTRAQKSNENNEKRKKKHFTNKFSKPKKTSHPFRSFASVVTFDFRFILSN